MASAMVQALALLPRPSGSLPALPVDLHQQSSKRSGRKLHPSGSPMLTSFSHPVLPPRCEDLQAPPAQGALPLTCGHGMCDLYLPQNLIRRGCTRAPVGLCAAGHEHAQHGAVSGVAAYLAFLLGMRVKLGWPCS